VREQRANLLDALSLLVKHYEAMPEVTTLNPGLLEDLRERYDYLNTIGFSEAFDELRKIFNW
jgi:hypothetical protein